MKNSRFRKFIIPISVCLVGAGVIAYVLLSSRIQKQDTKSGEPTIITYPSNSEDSEDEADSTEQGTDTASDGAVDIITDTSSGALKDKTWEELNEIEILSRDKLNGDTYLLGSNFQFISSGNADIVRQADTLSLYIKDCDPGLIMLLPEGSCEDVKDYLTGVLGYDVAQEWNMEIHDEKAYSDIKTFLGHDSINTSNYSGDLTCMYLSDIEEYCWYCILECKDEKVFITFKSSNFKVGYKGILNFIQSSIV